MPRLWEVVPDCLRCPICHSELAPRDRALRCERGHSFDVSREGYVNLLSLDRKLSPAVGDSRAMLRSRQAFLASGHYARLADAVNERTLAEVRSSHVSSDGLTVVDVGCGTGYYLNSLHSALRGAFQGRPLWSIGLDVSRDAVRLAAKASRDAYFVVADVTRALPLADASVSLALNIFAPRNAGEFARIMRADGILLVVIPSPGHLASLREWLPLLSIEPDKSAHIAAQLARTFHLTRSETLEFELNLTGADVVSLVEMTPAARHLTALDRDRLACVGSQRTLASFDLLRFRRFR